jgi:uncharacterized protein (TIGR02687 family)
MNPDRIQNTLTSLFDDDSRWPHQGRKLVFWYDTDGQFQDTYDELNLDGVEKIQLDDTPFTLKHRLLIEHPNQPCLLYAPFPEPAPGDNWLLDLQQSGLTFSADRAAIIYADLGFHERRLESVIRRHLKFFNSEKKRAPALQAMQLPADTSEQTLLLAMLCVVAGLKIPDAPVLIRQVLMQGLLETDNSLWSEITRFVSAEAFWQVVQDHFSLRDDKPSLKKLLTRLLVTHLGLSLRGALPSALAQYSITPGQQAYAFIEQWMRDQQDAEALKALSQEIGKSLDIFNLLEPLPPEDLYEAATFEEGDQVIIRRCVADVLAQPSDISRWRPWLNARRTLPWFDKYEGIYEALLAAIDLLELKAQYEPGFSQSAIELFTAYANGLYQFDQAYRRFIVASDNARGDVLKPVVELIEGLYVNWYLAELGEAWSDALGDTWPVEGLSRQDTFFSAHVSRILKRNDREKVFVIISDAMRYEVAAELKETIEKDLRGPTLLASQITLLPSVTRLGMAALLPGRTLDLIPDSSDVKRDGLSTMGAEARQKVLDRNTDVSAKVLLASDLLDINTEQGRELIKPHRLFYIFHDVIDATGDKAASEREVLDACSKAIQQVLRLVKRICNSLNGTHVIVTADHGFLYQRRKIEDPDRLPLTKAEDVIKTNRRYVLRSQPLDEPGTLAFPAPYAETKHTVVVPRGSVRFRVQGAGAQYVHGGASLQEVCVPVISYHHKRAEKGDEGPIQKVGVQVSARARRVTNNRFRVNLVQSNAIEGRWRARTVVVGLYDPTSGSALTDEKTVILNSTGGNPSEREFPQTLTITAVSPPSSAYLIVRDHDDDEALVRETWTVSLGIINDFGDF